jgi:RimJ/RimL family protein N-acetyltransferase
VTTRTTAEPLRTGRLDLLPLRVRDADEMAEALSDPALHTFIGGAPSTAVQLRARYARLTANSPDPAVSWCNWVIRLRDRPGAVGTVQATVTGYGTGASGEATPATPAASMTPVRGSGLTAEIAWVVGTPWQGRGIATEAARALVHWLTGQQVTTVVAHVHPDHAASAAVARAAGLHPTDRWHDGEVRWEAGIAG